MKLKAEATVLADPTGLSLATDTRQAGEAFEALLISAVWKQALNGPRLSDLLDDGSASRMFREMQVDAIAARMAARGGFGVAKALEAGADTESGG